MSDLVPYGERVPHPAPQAFPSAPSGGDPAPAGEEETIDLREIFAVLRRQVWLVAGVAAVVLGATAFLVLRQAPQYRAKAMIRFLDERQALTGGIGGSAMEQVMGKTNDPLLSQLQVLRSRAVTGSVVDQLGLRLRPLDGNIPVGSLRDVEVPEGVAQDTLTLRFEEAAYAVRSKSGATASARYGEPVSLAGIRFGVAERPQAAEGVLVVRERGATIDWVLQNLRAGPREKTDVIEVEFTTGDPLLAQRVVNTVVGEFRSMNARAAQDQSRRRRIFLEEQLAQTDSVLAGAQMALTDFQRREEVFSSKQKFAAQQSGMMELEMRREELDADRRMLQSLLSGLEGESASSRRLRTLVSAPGVAANPVIGQLYNQLVRYETSRDSLVTGEWASAASHPDVQRLNTLIGTTRGELVDAVRSHIAATEARVAALDDLKTRSVAELQGLPATGAEEARLVQRVETVSKMADQLREEYQKARIAEAVEAGQVQVVDEAPLPHEPIGSGKGMKLALGLMLGLMLGGGGALMVEHLNTSIRRREDLEGMLRVPGLAVIPQIATSQAASRRAWLSLPGIRNGARPGGPLANGAEPLNELVTVSDLRSSGSEAYRTLRTNLIFSQAVQSLKTLVVTSSAPAEGKTTTAANLAVAFAQQGMRVLIVDCDLRKARLHNVFGLAREPGLTQFMLGYSGADEAVRSTVVDGLFVLPAGTLPPNPSELLGGERMREVLDQLRREFDLVILDTPPLLAAADAAVLGKFTDGVLLVVRAGHTDRSAAQHAMQQLRTVGARVVGAVLNDPDAKVASYGGYYYYNYYGAKA